MVYLVQSEHSSARMKVKVNYLMNLLDCKQEKTHCKEVIEVIEVVCSPQKVEALVRLELR